MRHSHCSGLWTLEFVYKSGVVRLLERSLSGILEQHSKAYDSTLLLLPDFFFSFLFETGSQVAPCDPEVSVHMSITSINDPLASTSHVPCMGHGCWELNSGLLAY